jgi:hypothetical protein
VSEQPVSDGAGPLEALRAEPQNPHGFKGYGPLLALGVLLVLMVLLAPTVAPEQVVLVPSDETTTTEAVTTTPPTVTTTGVPEP